MLIDLMTTFFLVGLASFGGGYAMIPLVQEEVLNRHHWMSAGQLADLIAVAGMSPGPIATNIAVAVGFREAGLPGATLASIAVVFPSFVLVLLVGKWYLRSRDHVIVKSSFYGLRSIVVGMICYAAISFAQQAGLFAKLSWFTWSQILIFGGSLCSLMFLRKHPVTVLMISGLVGIALYA